MVIEAYPETTRAPIILYPLHVFFHSPPRPRRFFLLPDEDIPATK